MIQNFLTLLNLKVARAPHPSQPIVKPSRSIPVCQNVLEVYYTSGYRDSILMPFHQVSTPKFTAAEPDFRVSTAPRSSLSSVSLSTTVSSSILPVDVLLDPEGSPWRLKSLNTTFAPILLQLQNWRIRLMTMETN